MFPTCHGRNLLNQDETAPLRRPRKAEAASTKRADGTTSPVPGKTEDVPTCHMRTLVSTDDAAPLRRPRKAEAASTKRADGTISPVPGKLEDLSTSTFRKTESASVCVARKTEELSAPVSTKAGAVSSPSPVPTLPLRTSDDISGPDKATLLLLRELLSRVQYSADDEEAQEHIHNLYRHLKVYGKMLDGSCKGEVNSVFVVLRDLGRDPGLAYLSRLLLLELIELRAAGWEPSPHLHSYYAGKLEKFPEIKSDDLPAPSNASAVESLLSCLKTPKGFSPRVPEESKITKKEEKKKTTCQETIAVCVSLADKVFEPAEKMRRLEERCRAKLECYPDADGEDDLVTITAESQAGIDHAVNVIEEAIAEVEREERQRRRRSPPADVWHRPRGGNTRPADSWGNFQYTSYQDKIAARARHNGGTLGNGTTVISAPTIQRPVRKETTTTLVFSHRHEPNIIPAKPVPEPVPVFTPARPVQDDLDWDDLDDNSDLFVWRAHKTLASEVNRLAAVKESNVGFDNQREIPSGKIKTKKTNQNAPSPTEKQLYSSTSSEEGQKDRIPTNTSYNNSSNAVKTCKPDNDVNAFYGGTVPVSKASFAIPVCNCKVHQSSDISPALEKTFTVPVCKVHYSSGTSEALTVTEKTFTVPVCNCKVHHQSSDTSQAITEKTFTVPVCKVHHSSDTSQALTEKTSYEVVHRDRTSSPEGNSSSDAKSMDSLKPDSFSEPQGDTSLTTTPLLNGVKDDETEKQTKATMWAGWVDGNTRSPMELSENVDIEETVFFPEKAPSFVDGDVQNHHSASPESDSSPFSDLSADSLVGQNEGSTSEPVESPVEEYKGQNQQSISKHTTSLIEECRGQNQQSISEHAASRLEEWNEDDIYYSDEDDLLDTSCENCCPPAPLSASPESPNVIIEEEFYLTSRRTMAPITEENEKDSEDNNNNDSSVCEDTVNNNNNNNNKTDETKMVQDICNCSTVLEDDVDVNNRHSPFSMQASCDKGAAVDVTSSSRIDDVKSAEANSAEKPRTLLATRPQFQLPRFLVNTIRQPINPLYHQVILDRGPPVTLPADKNMGPDQRRFLFAKTAKLYYDHRTDRSEVQWEGGVKRYSRDVLLRFSHSPACNVKPAGLPSLPCVQ